MRRPRLTVQNVTVLFMLMVFLTIFRVAQFALSQTVCSWSPSQDRLVYASGAHSLRLKR